MIKAGIGQSEHIDTRTAVKSVILQCREKLLGLTPQVGIVLAGVNFDHRIMLSEILHEFPGIKLIGCTTAGEFSSNYGFSDDSISLMVFYSDDIEIGVGVGRSLSENPETAVRSAVKQASKTLSKQASLCLVFPDGYNKSFNLILEMLDTALDNDCPVFGGAAGTQWNEGIAPRQFYQDEILEDSMPIMIFGGPLEYSFTIANSWRPIGKQARITKSEGRNVEYIDDFKAVDFYRHYLGDHSEPPRQFILAVFEKNVEHFYLRAPIDYNPDGSITFSESIPQGATVQLTEAIREVIIEDTKNTAQKISQQFPGIVPEFAMAFSCAFRKDMLGTRVGEEIRILKDNLPGQLPVIGFYSFGEIAPLAKGKQSILHGATLVTLLVGQRSARAAATGKVQDARPSIDTPAPLNTSFSDLPPSMEGLQLENMLLKRKLNRSEFYRRRLEELKDFTSTMHRKIIQEVEDARKEQIKALALAAEVQSSLLPQYDVKLPGLDVAGKNISCEAIGGDYYDFLEQKDYPDSPFSIVVGDIAGHGVDAALLMTTARAFLRMRASQSGNISEIITEMNHHLTLDVLDTGRFMTLFYLAIDPNQKRLQWVRAGHDPAVLYDPAQNRFEELAGTGIALGVNENFRYEQNLKTGITDGQIIALGTDGIWEACNREGKMFGKKRFREVIRCNSEKTANDILGAVYDELYDHTRGLKSEDDITLVVAKVDNN